MATDRPSPPAPDSDLETLRADPELARIFLSETFDHLSSIEPNVVALEANPHDEKLLNDIFRPFHSLKANAGALGLAGVADLAHRVEGLLDRARSGACSIGAAETEIVLATVDLLTSMVHDVESRLAGRQGEDFDDRRAQLVAALDRLGDATSASDETAFSSLPDHQSSTIAELPVPESQGQPAIKVDTYKLDSLVDLVGELAIVQSMIHQDPNVVAHADARLNRNLAQLHRITTELQRGAIAMRLVPIRQTFQRMRRLVRDLSQKSGKPLELTLSGEDTEIDRKVVEEIVDPLMHMVRNGVDHGIEDVETRLRSGKPAEGHLSLTAYHEGGNVVITVADDGNGLDAEKLSRKAVEQGLAKAGTPLSEAEIHALIFTPGFSTAHDVTEISGRGVGMDVVRRNVEGLRGRIEIQNRPGAGTTFLIKLPLTLATVEGLLVGVGDQRFVLPTFAVHESFRPAADNTHVVPGQGSIVQVRGQLLPLARLADLFRIAGAAVDPSEAVVIVLEDDRQRLALMVDRLLGKQEIVIKSLGEAMVNIDGVAGGAILSDGQVGLILDARGLIRLAEREMPKRAA